MSRAAATRRGLARVATAVAALALCGVATAAAGCSGEQRAASTALRPLEASRATQIILEAFAQANVTPERGRRIQLRDGHTMEIDVAVQGRPHGVDFVSAQDRVDFGSVLPQRRQQDSLLTTTGVGPDANTDVLLLDEREFLYEPDPARAGPGRPTNIEVEDRLHRAVIDYLTYLRQHGEL